MQVSSISARRLVFPAKQEVRYEPFELPGPLPGQVLVRTRLTLMSTGTENIVFNRKFDPGTHWDNWVKYPFYPGYCAVGTVEDATDTGIPVGTRVAMRMNHQSHAVLSANDVFPLLDTVAEENGLWFALAKIAFNGALAAEYKFGQRVLIIGAGPIGQMSVRWASAAGVASIVVADGFAERLAWAQSGGATAVFSIPIEQAREEILKAGQGNLPNVVIDSTGNAEVFTHALELAAWKGRVVVLGDTGTPASQHLTSDVIVRGIHIVGAHDCHYTHEWNDRTITQFFFSMIATKRFNLDGLITHRFAPEECAEAYATVNRERQKTMGVVFDWTR